MRVLVAGTYGERNGIEAYTRHLVAGLGRAGHEVFLADRSAEHRAEPGDRALRLRRRSWPVWRAVGPFEAMRVHGRLRAEVRRLRPEVVHLTYPELAARSVRPLVMTAWHPETGVLRRAATARERGERTRHAALFAASDRIALRRADGVVATSRMVERAVAHGSAAVDWIPPFLPDEVIRPLPRRRDRSCLMVAGELDHPRKGLDLAISAVAALRRSDPMLRLVLVGGWISRDAPSRLPGFCDVRGVLAPDRVEDEMRRAGCLLLPSLWEEFGYVALEALAVGTPVASTPLPGFEGLDTNGLVEGLRRDPKSLAEAASRAIDLTEVSYPDACRASAAITQIARLYDAVSR